MSKYFVATHAYEKDTWYVSDGGGRGLSSCLRVVETAGSLVGGDIVIADINYFLWSFDLTWLLCGADERSSEGWVEVGVVNAGVF